MPAINELFRPVFLAFVATASCGGTVSTAEAVDAGSRRDSDSGSPDAPGTPDASRLVPVQISAGLDSACALFSDGTVSCWGTIAGVQAEPPNPIPSALPDAVDVQWVDAGGFASCLLSKGGAVSCFGDDTVGSVGDGHYGQGVIVPTPTQIISSNVAAIRLGDTEACALTADGVVSCWGGNRYGEIGPNGGPVGLGAVDATPTPVTGLPPTAVVAVGLSHVCALSVDHDTTSCWGYGEDGELGDGMSGAGHDRSTPEPVAGMPSDVSTIALGGNVSCAIANAGEVWCWGWNGEAELGTGGPGASATTPTRIPGLPAVTQVSVGHYDEVCAVTTTGATYCWGTNLTTIDEPDAGVQYFAPTLVTGVPAATQVTVGADSACLLGVDSTVWCWGVNDAGQCGPLASGDFVTTPVQVPF